jgi:1-pyrroline-5-carboxylate dehydrogenase
VDALAVALVRGAYEYQGQKCSAASRAYIPDTLWPAVRDRMAGMIGQIRMGDVADFRNFMGAVIDRRAFERISGHLERAKRDPGVTVVAGGGADGSVGWFVEPTLLQVEDPGYRLMCEEIFGPVLTVHVYPEARWAETLELVDRTSPYALTGAVFARDRSAVAEADRALRYAAGNFYVNDKPTGAVVGQQPFGGARASGTNDKAGSILNLQRWVSPRTIKETFVPPTEWRYPFMGEA